VTRRATHALVAVLLAGVLVACQGTPPPAVPAAALPPAQRIVTLSPHLAELVYSAGAGERLVGVVEFSDFPAPVRSLPRVGDSFRVDYEAVAALRPDLILAWKSGNPPETVQRLRDLGFRVVAMEPVQLADIAAQIVAIGALAGTEAAAGAAAAQFEALLAALRAESQGATPVSVFVQLSERPYFTVTDSHFLGQGLRLCGGRNVFGALPGLTANVSLEAIIAAAPDVIIASDMAGSGESPLAGWARWKGVPAVARGNLYTLDADLLSRPGARILDGVAGLCDILREARKK